MSKTNFTVAELIEKLKEFDPNLPVAGWDPYNDDESFNLYLENSYFGEKLMMLFSNNKV